MDALQANHDERPANPCGRAHPFSSVHPYGPPCESRAEAPGPSCLCSIAQALTAAANLGKQWKPNCGSVCLADRRLAVLAHYSPKNSVQTYFSFRFPALGFAPAAVEAASSCSYASHYGVGDGFHGLRAADGSRFNAHGLTTAHRHLPFGTRLRVINPSNNKTVMVTVTDRGPFVPGRSLDLSYGAFAQIASPSQGVARVCYSVA
jgi:rare lipoprotein A